MIGRCQCGFNSYCKCCPKCISLEHMVSNVLHFGTILYWYTGISTYKALLHRIPTKKDTQTVCSLLTFQCYELQNSELLYGLSRSDVVTHVAHGFLRREECHVYVTCISLSIILSSGRLTIALLVVSPNFCHGFLIPQSPMQWTLFPDEIMIAFPISCTMYPFKFWVFEFHIGNNVSYVR